MFEKMGLRTQVVVCILFAQILVLGVTTAALVYNARDAVSLEIASSEKSARALMLATLGYALQELPPTEVLPHLADTIVEPRHVDIALVDAKSGVLPLRKISEIVEEKSAPNWFARLVTPPLRETRFPIEQNGTLYGYISMTNAPGDEISEVWEDIESLFGISVFTTLLSALVMAALVNRALRPLGRVRDALGRLRDGELSTRIGKSHSADLIPIFSGFDRLSEALEEAESDRARLNRRIVELGDAERRSIAMELHDEFGPCLFGLKVKAGAILQSADKFKDETLKRDAETIQSIVSQIQASNSRLLTTLRPMTIGQLPLLDALGDLFSAFRKTHPRIDWKVELPNHLEDTSEIFDLTVYRFFQEGSTNALRHGEPSVVKATLVREQTRAGPVLRCVVEDDGVGMASGINEGRGLTSMRDRIDAVGGKLEIAPSEAAGFKLVATIPILREDLEANVQSVAS